ncbi:MAG: glycosyltransferase family 2 protein [Flavihumibacter sp.]|jgi:GT2 family glycosyltransferase|nr:glycosyltransferase family 2 protein [Flavihumibacter sp.]
MQVSVVIVNYNVCYFLELCLRTVQLAMANLEAEIIVVDNASTDESRQYLPPRFPDVQFIWNDTNLGFSKANNLGVAGARGKYVLILNPDTLVPENCLITALDFFAAHPDAGALGMRMFDGRFRFLPESKRGFPNLATAFFKLSGLIHLFPRHRVISNYYLGHLSADYMQEVEVLAGAFMFIPRELYLRVGGFDERYFMYAEDIDLSYSIASAGYRTYYLPEPGIIHFKGESTLRTAANARHFYEAMLLFRQKYGNRVSFLSRSLAEAAIKARTLRDKIRSKKSIRPEKEILSRAAYKICRELSDYNPDQPCLFVLGDSISLEELFTSLRQQPPRTPIRFKWKNSNVWIGSDDPDEKGEIIRE